MPYTAWLPEPACIYAHKNEKYLNNLGFCKYIMTNELYKMEKMLTEEGEEEKNNKDREEVRKKRKKKMMGTLEET
jgi:hypothetical protein